MKTLLIAAATALVVGCASSGNTKLGSMTESAVRDSVPINAEKAQVEQTFGPPDLKTFSTDGQEVWTYQHAYASAKASSFIPIIGPFVGGTDVERKQLTVLFSEDGRVAKVLWNSAPTEVRYGR
jgi:outer membrane protein assembly factor BamE (lipoprotein component of BamABCDE complex)